MFSSIRCVSKGTFLVNLIMIILMVASHLGGVMSQTCFGFSNSSGYECVHQLGSCITEDTCFFSPATMIYGMGMNTNAQLGFTSSGTTDYPIKVNSTFNRIFYISKMSNNNSIITDYNGNVMVSSNSTQQFESSTDVSQMRSTQDYPIAVLGDDETTAYITTTNKIYVSGTERNNNLGRESFNDMDVLTPTLLDQYINVVDASISSMGGCAIHSPNGTNFNITFWGPASKSMFNGSFAAVSQSAISPASRPLVKCEVVSTKSYGGADAPAIFVLDDLGNLFAAGAKSYLEGNASTETTQCDYGQCFTNPVLIGTNVDSFKCSSSHCVAIVNGTNIYGWGNNTYGQVGNSGSIVSVPTKIFTFAENVIQVTATKNNVYALTESGNIYGMGSNDKGQLGRSPSVFSSRNTIAKIVIPDQRRRIWHMADGPNSEHLLAFSGFKCSSLYNGTDCSNPLFKCGGLSPQNAQVCSGKGICGDVDYCICNSGFIGQFCNVTSSTSCFGKLSTNSSVCSQRGTCTGNNQCTCASPFMGNECQSFKPDFAFTADFSELPSTTVNDTFSVNNLIIKPVLNISSLNYYDVYSYTQYTSKLYLTGNSYNWQGTELVFDKTFVNTLKPGFYILKSESIVNVTNEIFVVNKTYTFEKVSTSQTSPLTLDQTGTIYVSKSGSIVVSALITDPYFDASTYSYDWMSRSDQESNYQSVKSFTSVGSNQKITFSRAANDILPTSFSGSNYTVIFRVTYSSYLGASNPFETYLTVIINTKIYSPTITLNRFPLSSYLSITRPTSLSAVLAFAETIPSDLVISYLWSLNQVTLSGATQSSVIVYPSQLTSDTLYEFVLTVTVTYKGDATAYVSTLNIRTPPALPSYPEGTTVLAINPSDGTGIALLTAHNITVAPLVLTDNRLLKYTVRYSFNGTDANTFKDLATVSATTFKESLYLPYGSMTLQIYIEDEYGNKLTAGNLAVSTQNIDLSSLANIVNSRNLSLNQIETTATTLNTITGQDTKSVREKLSELLLSKLDTIESSSSTSQAILSISQRSSDITLRASQFLILGASVVGGNIRTIYASGGEVDKIASALTSSLSNIVDNKNISTTDNNQNITSSLSSISRELAKTLLPSQTLSINSNNFNILLFGSSSTKSTNYTVEGTSISTPDNFDEYLSGATSSIQTATKAYSVELLYYKASLFESVGRPSNSSRSSNILSFVISASSSFGSESRSTVSIKGLTKPLVFTFNVANASTDGFECKFIDEINNYWKTDGCSSLILNENTVQCSCNHATKFSTFRLFIQSVTKEEYLGNMGIRIVNVIFGAIYFLLAAMVFIALIVLRNINPVRSRYIGPYIGLIAIMVDSLIISFIQNIVVLSLDKGTLNTTADIANIRNTSDGFNYFNVILVIPLYLTAFFTFLVQIVRYFIKRHMYEFMSNKVLFNAQIYRAITSKVAFWVTLLVSLAVIMAYYTIWVGLGGGNVFVVSKTTAQQDKERMTFTYITSLSYFGLAWIIAICMVIIASWDLFYMNRHLFVSCCYKQEDVLKKSSSSLGQSRNRVEKLLNMLSRTKKQKVQLGKSAWLTIPQVYYFTDDNLYFRLEIHVFIAAFLFLTINYLAGIADISVISVGLKDAASRLGPQIVSLVAGILYTFSLIAAFGGVIVVSHLTERRRKTYNTESTPQSKMDEDELNVVLGDRFGKPLFVEFCQKEFSLENVYFYDAITEFLRNSDSRSDADVRNSISEMFEKYIKTGSEYEVNLPSASKKAFISIFENSQASSKTTKDMFDSVMISVMYNLKDTYSRFSMTEEFKLYQQSRDNISMLENNFL